MRTIQHGFSRTPFVESTVTFRMFLSVNGETKFDNMLTEEELAKHNEWIRANYVEPKPKVDHLKDVMDVDDQNQDAVEKYDVDEPDENDHLHVPSFGKDPL